MLEGKTWKFPNVGPYSAQHDLAEISLVESSCATQELGMHSRCQRGKGGEMDGGGVGGGRVRQVMEGRGGVLN